jgi:hypothetical protein
MGAPSWILRGLLVGSAILPAVTFGLYRMTADRFGGSTCMAQGSESGPGIPVNESAMVFVPATEIFDEVKGAASKRMAPEAASKTTGIG